MKTVIYSICLFSLAICETTMAVFDFSNNGLSNNEVLTLTDRLRTELVRVSDNKIVERSKIDDILKEQKFQMSGCVDECLIELGKMLGAKMGRQLGCDPQTAQRVLKETGFAYLFDDSKNTYLE